MKIESLANVAKIVDMIPPATDAAGRTSRYISLKTAAKCSFLVAIAQGAAAPVTVTVLQAQDVAGTASKALAINVPIYANLDTAASDDLVRRADGISYVTDAGLKNKLVYIEIDPSFMDINNGFDCIAFSTSASNLANLTQGVAILTGLRYGQQLPTSAIVN